MSRFENISQDFLRLEDELDLFGYTIDGIHFWERIRFGVHAEILRKLGITGQAHSRIQPGFSAKANLVRRAFASLFHHNPFVGGPRQLAFFGHPRRKRRADGKWWDIYCDPVIDAVNYTYVYYENPYLGRHLRPAKTEEIRYLDLAGLVAAMRKRLLFSQFRLTGHSRRLLTDIETALSDWFGTRILLRQRAERALLARQMILPVYRTILEGVDPKLTFLVCSYGKEDLIEACQDLGLPTVELQHGVMDKYHMGYSLSGNGKKRLFPDHLFMFGEYWAQNVDLPLPEERVHIVGYPYLESERRRFANVQSRRQILFISQGTIGSDLSRIAVESSRILASRWHIIYKLHPGEYTRWREEYPWLREAEGVTVVSDEVPLYQLFAESKAQVGVSSTALFEGLAFGLSTYLARLPGVTRMRSLWERGYAGLVSSAEELEARIVRLADKQHVYAEEFFASGSERKVQETTDALLRS